MNFWQMLFGGMGGTGGQQQQFQSNQDLQQQSMNQMLGMGGGSAWTPPPPTGNTSWDAGAAETAKMKNGADQTVKIQIEAPDMNAPAQPPTGAPPQQGYQPPGQPPAPYPSAPTMGPSGPNDPYQNAPPGGVAPPTPPTPPGAWSPAGGAQAPMQAPTITAPGGGPLNIPGLADPGAAPTAPTIQDPNQVAPEEKSQYGGQDMFADPDQADYDSVQQYGDQAYEQSMKRMQPQHDEQNRRLQQDMINKGIDPNSAQGQQMADQLSRQQADQMNSANFSALQFGQGVQQQMANQQQQKANLAGQMQQGLWGAQGQNNAQNLQKYGMDQGNALGWGQLQSGHNLGAAGQANQYNLGAAGLQNQRDLGFGNMNMQAQIANANNAMQGQGLANQYNLGMRGQDLQARGQDIQFGLGQGQQDLSRYQGDQQHQLGQGQLDLGRQSQNFNEMMGMDAAQYRNWQGQQQQQNWQDQFTYNMMMGNQGFNPGNIGGGDQFTSGPSNVGGNIMQGIGSVMPTPSDRRLKKNIQKVGEIGGTNIYRYDYLWDEDGTGRVGVMAQEVPWASVDMGGYLGIDPRKVFDV